MLVLLSNAWVVMKILAKGVALRVSILLQIAIGVEYTTLGK